MDKGVQVSIGTTGDVTSSRRQALALMLGAGYGLPGLLAGADGSAPVRLAISESLVTDVNINDARAAMSIWLKRMGQELHMVVEWSPKVFEPTEEILRRARRAELDAVALNIVEYRQIADVLDPSQIIAEGGAAGLDQYVLLVKRNSGIERLGDLRGRKLCTLKSPRMCVASAWLSTILDEGHFAPSENFFSSQTADTKASRVVLPVFFGQADACLTTRRSFDTMCELNPQVAKDLATVAISPAMVLTFYVFRRNYHGISRESFAKIYADMPATAAGRQIAVLFQFESLVLKDVSCLASALNLLEAAERATGRRGAGDRKG